ncbi:MAG: aminodeoxychorismate/anthranilate synthase component II [Deferribacteres bacterium]|nr:aminodeoxychorismate/anthranilate synthase component II [candidate division KSB1 bacterium]MCB9501810.1 aminodeoxychorismate/anthranilate synthase component II [Deferribacteres bacterium]
MKKPVKILVIDNFDSFTYNLVQYLGELGAELEVYRNTQITIEQIRDKNPDGILLSPGPGVPDTAGITLETITAFAGEIPILGVCLGHQAIGQAFGGDVVRAPELMHGKVSEIFHNNKSIFASIPSPFTATRYHSLIVEEKTLPTCLHITARTENGLIMGLEHESLPVYGVQFHPESILTESGKRILQNYLDKVGDGNQ